MANCIKCSEKATHKYNQLKEMCLKHYLEILEIVKAICGKVNKP